jgi:hypothetical protein
VDELIAIEVAITWAAAAGCLFYLVSMFRSGEHGSAAQRFLIAILAAVLLVRGFFWMTGDLRLAQLTFAFATWLPLAITLFFERVLRRHHPLWVKLFALTVSVLFFVSDMIPGLFERRAWHTAFGVCFALVVVINGTLLLMQRNAGLLTSEKRVTDLLLLIAFVSAPLVLSDFRTLLPIFPIRLGGLAALLFVYALLGSAVLNLSAWMWLARFVILMLLALALSALLAFALQGTFQESWWQVAQRAWPVAFAWTLLTGIVVNRMAIASDVSNNAFLRWLARAPLASNADFLASLTGSPDASTHLVVQSTDLGDYSITTLARLADVEDGVVSLRHARARRGAGDNALAESAEQWIDLFERLQMTHGFIARRDPLTVTLVSLPATTSAAAAEARLRVVQNISRQLGAGG